MIFDGQRHEDASGCEVNVPDVEVTGIWYDFPFQSGFAVFPTSLIGRAIMAYENDDTAGQLKLKNDMIKTLGGIIFKCIKNELWPGKNNDDNSCATSGLLDLTKAFLSTINPDDRYDKPIRFTESASGTYEANAGDWILKWKIENR